MSIDFIRNIIRQAGIISSIKNAALTGKNSLIILNDLKPPADIP